MNTDALSSTLIEVQARSVHRSDRQIYPADKPRLDSVRRAKLALFGHCLASPIFDVGER